MLRLVTQTQQKLQQIGLQGCCLAIEIIQMNPINWSLSVAEIIRTHDDLLR
ncbi:hypothetical protein P20652_3219 [Pseudoalteromonas sp. BSi20652]|nr:hypothetical protein P20652_3219 [Pseudoalteromonas sp. BSi20652]